MIVSIRSSGECLLLMSGKRNYEVELAAPGYDKKDFKIDMDDGLLTVSAERREEKQNKDGRYTRREFGCASFSRSFSLPSNTNEEDVDARYEDGILKMRIAKKEGGNGKVRKPIAVR